MPGSFAFGERKHAADAFCLVRAQRAAKSTGVSLMDIPRFNVLGVAMSAMDLRIATQAVLEACEQRRKGYVCVTGVHGVTEAQHDEDFRRILNGAFLNTCDGMPLVWVGR